MQQKIENKRCWGNVKQDGSWKASKEGVKKSEESGQDERGKKMNILEKKV
jgi:hypothetical protein